MEHFKEILERIITTIKINPYDSEVDKAKKIIWYSLAGSVVILLVVSWLIFSLITFSKGVVKIPQIEGNNVYIALNKLYEKRLIAHASPRYSENVELGGVYNQNPKQGSVVKSGRIVSFNVSLGSKELALPDFRGFTLFDLQEFLDKKYPNGKVPFNVENPVYEYNDEVEKDRIIRQEPNDGTPVYNLKKIKLWISNGPKVDSTHTLKNYIGKKVDAVSKELVDLEMLYTYEFVPVGDRWQDMTIIDQSIGEGKPIDELIQESKPVILKVNQYQWIDGERIKGTYLLDIPKKPLVYLLEVKIKTGTNKEKLIMKKETKGGVSVPVSYTGKTNSKLLIYYDGKLANEIELILEQAGK